MNDKLGIFRRLLLAAMAAGSVTAAVAQAPAYPARPVKLVVGFAPGGAADYVARVMSEAMGKSLGQPIVIENRAGGGSSIAADMVAKSAPDGYTVLIASPSSISVNPALNPKLGYSARDLQPVGKLTSSPLVLAVNPATGIASVQELIERARKAPGTLNYATSGNGSAPHLGAALFLQITGVQMTHIPFRGGAPAIQSVIAGDTQLTFGTPPSVLPQANAGRLRALAVSTREGSALVPGVPGSAAAGLPDYAIEFWYGRHAGADREEDLRRGQLCNAAAPGQGGTGARGHRGVAVGVAGGVRRLPGRGRQVLGQAGEGRRRQAGVTAVAACAARACAQAWPLAQAHWKL
jgi:tripartite-type tricarboxylate transporter receptor subunit TctC